MSGSDVTDLMLVRGKQAILSAPEGTPPLEVVSTTVVANFNSDLLDGLHAEEFGQLAQPNRWAETQAFDKSLLLGGAAGSPWGANFIAIETPTSAMMMRTAGGDAFYILSNTYFDGSALRYKNAGPTAIVTVSSGFLDVTTAPSGAAGAPISGSVTALRIANSGNVLVRTAVDSGYAFDVNGSARVSGAFGANGATPVGKQTVPADATDLASAIALANAMRAAGLAFGLYV